MYGGAVHVVIRGELELRDCSLWSPDEDQELEDGTLVSSFGKKFVLTNVQLYQVRCTRGSLQNGKFSI